MELKRLKLWIKENNIDAIETAWMEMMERQAPSGDFFEVLEELKHAGKHDEGDMLGWMYLSDTIGKLPAETALQNAKDILPAIRGNSEIRSAAAGLFGEVFAGHEHFEAFLSASGLEGNQSLRRAIRTLDVCLSINSGMYLASRFEQQALRVKQYDEVMEYFELEDSNGRTVELDCKKLADDYVPVGENDFRVLAQFCPQRINELIKSDPQSLLKGICTAQGGQIMLDDLKTLLVNRGGYIPADKWSQWWSRARSAIRKCTNLTVEGKNPSFIVYHENGLTLESELAQRVKDAKVPRDHLMIIRDYARELRHRNLKVNSDFIKPIVHTLCQQVLKFAKRRQVDSLTASLAVVEAKALGLVDAGEIDCPSPNDVIAGINNPVESVIELNDPLLWEGVLADLSGTENAAEFFKKFLLFMPSNQLDKVAQYLIKHECIDEISRIINEMLIDPASYPQICIWLWSTPAVDLSAIELPNKLEILSRMLKIMEDQVRDGDVQHADRRDLFQQIRSALVAGDCKSFCQALEIMDEAVAVTYKRRIEQSHGLSDVARETLLSQLRKEHYTIFVKARVEPWLDETQLWTTEKSLARHEAELKDILEIKMPENSRAIGKAAALGDLRENAEWQYAIEEQRRLQAQVSQLQADLTKVRTIHPSDISDKVASIGSKVILKNIVSGTEHEVNILGPWETDISKKIYNYKTPLALEILGKSVAQRVTLKLEGEPQEYEITSLGTAL